MAETDRKELDELHRFYLGFHVSVVEMPRAVRQYRTAVPARPARAYTASSSKHSVVAA